MTRISRRSYEVGLNVLAVLAVPVIARLLPRHAADVLDSLGLQQIRSLLAGSHYYSDIGMEVAGARGLISRTYTTYDPMSVLGPLIGMGDSGPEPHTHPPTSFVLWLPLAHLPYLVWLPFFAMASVSAIALAMRLLHVPAWLAYPVAIAIAVNPTWVYALISTYPLTALAISVAWRYRLQPVASGAMYGLLAAARGFTGVLVLYPIARRQWKAVVVAVGLTVACLLVAVALEPGVVRGFMDQGMASVHRMLQRPDLFTASGLAVRHGLPSWLGIVVPALVAAIALWRRNDLFWVLVWFGLAAATLAWVQTTIALIPLAVMMFRSGVVGRVIVVLGIALLLGPLPAGVVSTNVFWGFAVALTGIGLVLSPVREDPGVWPNASRAGYT